MSASLTIDRRFNGPPDSANGGYACGVVANHVHGPAEVTLRLPPPLDTPMAVRRGDDGHVTVEEGERLVAEGGPAQLELADPPLRPTPDEAQEAMRHPFGERPQIFEGCFVCGHEREDGLGVRFGRLQTEPTMTAALFTPDASQPQRDGAVAPEIAWSALDCPSYTPDLWDPVHASLLARLTAELIEPLEVGRPVVAVGWPIERDGRKSHHGSALLAEDGRVLARARALWIRTGG